MKILIDMDDTIEKLLPTWLHYLNSFHKLHVEEDDIEDWDMRKAFPELTEEQIFYPLTIDLFWTQVQPKKDAQIYVEKLIKDGHEVYIVTNSNYYSLKSKMENCLFKWFPYLSWKNVIVTHNKQMIIGDVLVDDAPHNLIGGRYKKLLMSAPHNRHFETTGTGIVRVSNWLQAYEVIHDLKIV